MIDDTIETAQTPDGETVEVVKGTEKPIQVVNAPILVHCSLIHGDTGIGISSQTKPSTSPQGASQLGIPKGNR